MRIEVLGCSGGSAPGCRPTCLLINDTIALDAGALAQALSIERQALVHSVVLTHAHADHILTLPFFVENIAGQGSGTVDLYASSRTIEVVRRHLFNDTVWPDFARIPSRSRPVLRYREIAAGEGFELDGVRFTAVPVNHATGTFGFLIGQAGKTVLWSSDTGPTNDFWRIANRTPGLQAVFIETSFSSAELSLAEVSDHLTPATLVGELEKLERAVPVYVHHLKAASGEAIRREIENLARTDLELLREGEVYTF